MTWLAAVAPVVSRAMNSEECRSRKERDVLIDQRVEHPPLVQRDDAVADPRQHHRMSRRCEIALTRKITAVTSASTMMPGRFLST